MSDAQSGTGSKLKVGSAGGRSPAYPFISLEKALERVQQLKDAEGFYTVPVTSAYKAWGISEKSSSSPQVLAALKHFGLVEYDGSGASRSVKLSDMARRIIMDVRPGSADREKLIKQAALTPPIHRDLLKQYPVGFPSDATMQTFLVLERGFNENGAKSLIAEIKDTFAFAKVGEPDNIPSQQELGEVEAHGDDDPSSDIVRGGAVLGDLIQWESGGVLQFKEPQKVRAIHDDGAWVWVEGSNTAIPMNEVIVEHPSRGSFDPPPPPSKVLGAGRREDKASLDEGEVILEWPETLSEASVKDFEYWMKGIIHRARRRAGVPEKSEDE